MNVSGALDTLGKGLFAVAGVTVERENADIEHMRRVALQELDQKHRERLQQESQKFQTDLFDKETVRGQTMFGMQAAAQAGETQRSIAAHQELERQRQAFEAGRDRNRQAFEERLFNAKTIEEIRQSTEAYLRDIDENIKTLTVERAQLDPLANADGAKQLDAMIASYKRQREGAVVNKIAAERRALGLKPEPDDKAASPGAGSDAAPVAEVGKTPTASQPSLFDKPSGAPLTSAIPFPSPQVNAGLASQFSSADPLAVSPDGRTGRVPLEQLQSDPQKVATLARQIDVLRTAGKSNDEIRRMLGAAYDPRVFDIYLPP
jgi:hypothetical protein